MESPKNPELRLCPTWENAKEGTKIVVHVQSTAAGLGLMLSRRGEGAIRSLGPGGMNKMPVAGGMWMNQGDVTFSFVPPFRGSWCYFTHSLAFVPLLRNTEFLRGTQDIQVWCAHRAVIRGSFRLIIRIPCTGTKYAA